MSRPSVSIVAPAYNEEANIREVVASALEVLRRNADDYEVVIVDDASEDATTEIARGIAAQDPRVRFIRSDDNIGCHRAALLGMRAARCDLVFFIPADLQIRPDQLERCLPASAHADYVCTNRVRRADRLHRRLMSRGYNLAVRLAFRLPVHDVDSSVLVRKEVVDAVAPELGDDSDFIPVEMLVRAAAKGYRVSEVGIEHHPRVAGQATALTPKEAARTLVDLAGSVGKLRRLRRATSGR